MTPPTTLRLATATAMGGLLLLAGCSSSDSDPSADPSPAGSSAPSTTASAAAAECQVAGYVPSTAIEVRKVRPVVVYAHGVALAPASSMSSPGLDLARADLVRLKVRPDDSAVTLPAAVRRQILVSAGGPVEEGTLADTVFSRIRVSNDTSRNQQYLVYRGSTIHSGTWEIEACGAPYNDGAAVETLTGTYSTVGRLRPVAVARCGAPASGSAIDRYAARRECQDL